jgi:hypothetical protein
MKAKLKRLTPVKATVAGSGITEVTDSVTLDW